MFNIIFYILSLGFFLKILIPAIIIGLIIYFGSGLIGEDPSSIMNTISNLFNNIKDFFTNFFN